MVGVLHAERYCRRRSGRMLILQNACLQNAASAGIRLAGVVAQYSFPLTAGVGRLNAVVISVTAGETGPSTRAMVFQHQRRRARRSNLRLLDHCGYP